MQLADNTLKSLLHYSRNQLGSHFNERESQQLIHILFRHFFSLDRAEIVMQQDRRFTESEILKVHFALKKLKAGEPVQYVTGEAWFCGLPFSVNRSVLIPRPETEELVQLAMTLVTFEEPVILDVGTGSGCIAIALKNYLPKSHAIGIDNSPGAIATALSNSKRNNVGVEWICMDVLQDELPFGPLHLIVSNPPYIPIAEKLQLPETVTRFEPHQALFVPDNDPMVFYRRLYHIAMEQLVSGGWIVMEIHEKLAGISSELFRSSHFSNVSVHRDMQGKERMLSARKK